MRHKRGGLTSEVLIFWLKIFGLSNPFKPSYPKNRNKYGLYHYC